MTICTKSKERYFGEIVVPDDKKQHAVETDNYPSLRKTSIGHIAQNFWEAIPNHFPFVKLDEFVIMPNHMHGIIIINNPRHTSWQPNRFAPQSQNLPSIIRGYKASVKKFAALNNIVFCWQWRYFDRIIRNDHELQNIRQYIVNNPLQWHMEKKNIENIIL